MKSELSLKEDDFYEISLNFTPKYFEVSAELEMRLSDKIHSKSGLYLLKTKFSYDLENYTYDPKTTASQILDEVIPPDTRTTIATISTVNAALSAFVVRD